MDPEEREDQINLARHKALIEHYERSQHMDLLSMDPTFVAINQLPFHLRGKAAEEYLRSRGVPAPALYTPPLYSPSMGARMSPHVKGGLARHSPSPALAAAATAAAQPPPPPHAAYHVVSHPTPHLAPQTPTVRGGAAGAAQPPPPHAAYHVVPHATPHPAPQPPIIPGGAAATQPPLPHAAYHVVPHPTPHLAAAQPPLVPGRATVPPPGAVPSPLSPPLAPSHSSPLNPSHSPPLAPPHSPSLAPPHCSPLASHDGMPGHQRMLQQQMSLPGHTPYHPGMASSHEGLFQRATPGARAPAAVPASPSGRSTAAATEPAVGVGEDEDGKEEMGGEETTSEASSMGSSDEGEEDNWLDTGLPKATALAIHKMTQDEMSMKRITFQDVDGLGFKFKDEEVYDITGCMVNLADLTDAPEDASPALVYALTAINVMVHACFIWALGMPLIIVAIVFHNYHANTTSIRDTLTLQVYLFSFGLQMGT
ncbi:hypothetical protein DUNSADRAFT_5005 [Dunaliella salina]|uniref:Uncharacterized protein n=1 Tax=Dunaliella salina TaxID=3046 RepID=A0ABQ7GQV8_DUNSA|nr:hypothetical protein DUNSADRAFT_5005 [Dunaliella salina]|eukprot:KAF5836984.1 hypothetical protein DUNSADRAFT_5005 [Dunaliella salina]